MVIVLSRQPPKLRATNAVFFTFSEMQSYGPISFDGAAVPLPPVVDKEWILGSSDELIYIPYRYAREEEVWSFLIVSPMDLRASCINRIFQGTV